MPGKFIMPSAKPTILCTGPLDETLTNLPELKTVDIDVLPFTTIATNLPYTTVRQIKETLAKKANIVFTSSNAIKSVTNYLDGKQPDWAIFCISNTTYQLAKKYFGAENIKQTASTAKALAQKIIPNIDSKEVIFFCGNLRRNELPDSLRQKKIRVKEIVVYNTSHAPLTITKKYDAVLFFSPSAVESLFSKNTLPETTTLFGLGKTTAETIKKYSTNKIIIGDEPDKNKLVIQAIKGLTGQTVPV